ncbi:MAG: UvrD-helicase domain-containing protein, partial [Desulfosarcina sp.]|nr:UvrD-helicase domain-containing protein [Desulfobacterales bacterium]
MFSIPGITKKNKAKKKIRKKRTLPVQKNRIKSTNNLPDPNISWELNEEQQRAVLHENGPIMIIAGPGTGKTRTLTSRIAHLINKKKVPPENILAVTFTIKAAEEMRSRLLTLPGDKGSHPVSAAIPTCTTFHSLCYSILNDQADSSDIYIINDRDRNHIIK